MPRQLHSVDRLFLDLDSSEIDMGITPLYFYDPSGLPEGKFSYQALLAHVDRCVRTIPVLCGCLHRSPFDLDNPYLVEDKSYDVENHVSHHLLDDPTSIKELSQRITEFQENVLDTSLPLWDMMVISGLDIKTLPNNCFVVALKIHHAVVDGMTLMDLTGKLHGLTPIGEPVQLASGHKIKSAGLLGLATRVVSNNIKQSLQLVRPLIKVAPQMSVNVLNYGLDHLTRNADPVPVTRFAGNVSAKRAWGFASLDLAELNRVRTLFPSSTINDLVVTVIAGGLREYLSDKNELPDAALRALAPVNVRSEQERSQAGNEISLMSLSLPVEIDAPLERLNAVMRSTSKAKESQNKLGARNLSEIGKNIPAVYLSYVNKVLGNKSAKKFLGHLGNIVVTNVPGPTKELNLLGARLVQMSGIGPVADGVGLLHAVLSYNGTLTINVTSCQSMLPDIKFYIECLNNSYQRLLASVDERYERVIDVFENDSKKSEDTKIKTNTQKIPAKSANKHSKSKVVKG